MSDLKPPEPPSILDSLTREELVEAILLRERERDAFHDANTAAVKIAAFNLRGWRTALARAERAEHRMADCQRETDAALEQRNDLRAQAATDAATIAALQADLNSARRIGSALEADARLRAELEALKVTPPAAPDGAPALRPFDAIANDDKRRIIVIRFPKPTEWIGLDLTAATELRDQLDERILALRGIVAAKGGAQ